ncbi:MAG: protein O-mannosyl-transferase family, partial [Candidatus Promineifilaceae bacterium]
MNESIRTRIFRFSLTNRQTACATAFVLLTIYLGTLAPTLFVHDSAELAAGAMTLGIVHAPGYPVYLLTAHAFTHLPFGDVAYRVNLLSAVSTACAVGLLVWFLLQLRLSKPVASATGFVFGLSFYTWSLSVIAEVYTFQILVLALLFCGAWHWREQGDVRAFYLTAWVLGISAANNLATGLWWGGILVLLVWRASDKRQTQITRSVLGGAVLAFLFGLAFVLYLPLRSLADPALNYAGHFDETGTFYPLDLSQINNLVWYMTGGPFKTLVGSYTPLELI